MNYCPYCHTNLIIAVDLTKSNVITRLRGKKGFKRFSRDGYLSRLEDKTRRYYHKAEIKDFEGNECEWPMFYTYLIIDGVFRWLYETATFALIHF